MNDDHTTSFYHFRKKISAKFLKKRTTIFWFKCNKHFTSKREREKNGDKLNLKNSSKYRSSAMSISNHCCCCCYLMLKSNRIELMLLLFSFPVSTTIQNTKWKRNIHSIQFNSFRLSSQPTNHSFKHFDDFFFSHILFNKMLKETRYKWCRWWSSMGGKTENS